MAQIELDQVEARRFLEAKQQQAKSRKPSDEEPGALPARPKPSAPGPLRPDARRPLSARTPSSAGVPPPEILRQRAQVYGDMVSKIYLAEASRHPQPPLSVSLSQPPHLSRRFSNFRRQSAMTSSDVDPSQHLQPSLTMHSSNHSKLEWKASNAHIQDSTSVVACEGDWGLTDGLSTACTTLVMRNAALAVSERINIPAIPAPVVVDPHIPAYVIETQYSALDSHHKQKFRERFNLKRVSHRLSYTVLKQFTKIVRRDMAWDEFHEAAARSNNGRSCDKIRHTDFILVAQQLGIAMSAKKLLVVARRLDEKKNGFVEWEHFYAWWSAQYEDHFVTSRT